MEEGRERKVRQRGKMKMWRKEVRNGIRLDMNKKKKRRGRKRNEEKKQKKGKTERLRKE